MFNDLLFIDVKWTRNKRRAEFYFKDFDGREDMISEFFKEEKIQKDLYLITDFRYTINHDWYYLRSSMCIFHSFFPAVVTEKLSGNATLNRFLF